MQTGTDPALAGARSRLFLDLRDPVFHSQVADYLLLNYM
jgi:hypothetical protein